jgi:hypothetical protein
VPPEGPPPPPPPTLSAEQRELLELYDRLENIRLETALLRAYNNPLDGEYRRKRHGNGWTYFF